VHAAWSVRAVLPHAPPEVGIGPDGGRVGSLLSVQLRPEPRGPSRGGSGGGDRGGGAGR